VKGGITAGQGRRSPAGLCERCGGMVEYGSWWVYVSWTN